MAKPKPKSLDEYAAARVRVSWLDTLPEAVKAELDAGIAKRYPVRVLGDWLRNEHHVKVGKDALTSYVRERLAGG